MKGSLAGLDTAPLFLQCRSETASRQSFSVVPVVAVRKLACPIHAAESEVIVA